MDKLGDASKKGNCLICGKEDNFNVCIQCDAIKTAREIMYHVFLVGLGDYDAVDKKIKTSEALLYYEGVFKSVFPGLSKEEIAEFDKIYNKEKEELRSNEEYTKKIFKYNAEKNKLDQNIIYLYDAMRWNNIMRSCSGCRRYLCNMAKDKHGNIKNIISCEEKLRRYDRG